ncbi:MAG: hypothetical protein AAB212_02420 [Bacteroidota bacterium]
MKKWHADDADKDGFVGDDYGYLTDNRKSKPGDLLLYKNVFNY